MLKIRLVCLLMISAMVLTGCAAVKPELYKPKGKMDKLIMPLELQVDDLDKSILTRDESRLIIHSDFSENIFTKSVDRYGHAKIHIKRDDFLNIAWTIVSGLSLCTINLFGIPLGSLNVEVTMDVELLNSKDQSIAKYSVTADDTEYSAFLWGYNSLPLRQAARTVALNRALAQLKNKINADAESINEKLLAAGPMKRNGYSRVSSAY